jgi:hypothetical protein
VIEREGVIGERPRMMSGNRGDRQTVSQTDKTDVQSDSLVVRDLLVVVSVVGKQSAEQRVERAARLPQVGLG